MSIPCPKCGRLYTFDGTRCCNEYCRYGSAEKPKVDFTAVRRQRFSSEGGRKAIAIWIPAWYELDPPLLEVDLTAEFAFCRTNPSSLGDNAPLVFYSGMSGEPVDVAWGTIAAIRHSQFGQIQTINTRGLDYKFLLADGKEFVVNAEETPGQLFEQREGEWAQAEMYVTDWRFTIEFSALADREPLEPR